MKEFWLPIKGYENRYLISNCGNIKSLYTNKILKPVSQKSGYQRITLSKDNKKKHYYIHRLVGLHFLANNDLSEINHIDGDKTNNCVINLEWCSRSDNMKHCVNTLHKQLGKPKSIKCIDTGQVFKSLTDASNVYDGNVSNLCLALKNPHRKYAHYRWKYL